MVPSVRYFSLQLPGFMQVNNASVITLIFKHFKETKLKKSAALKIV